MHIFEFVKGWSVELFLFYFIIAVVFSFLCSKGVNKGKKGKLYFVIGFFLLWFFQTFRSINVGVDTEDYVNYFYDFCKYGWGATDLYANRELLFNVHLYLISRLSHSYTVLFAANALITNVALIIFINQFFKKHDSFVMLPLFVLNYIYDMAAMRSSLAVAFVLVAFVLLDKRKYIYCVLFSIVAFLFHNTTLVAFIIIMYRLFLLHNNDRVKGRTLFISTLAVAISIHLSVAGLQSALMETKYSGYAEELSSGWFGIWNLVVAFILSVYLMVRNRKRRQPFNTFDVVNVVAFALCPVIVQLGAYRLAKYFLMFRIMTYKTYFTELEQKNDAKLIVAFECVVMLLGLLFYMGRLGASLPYEFAPLF